MQFPKSKVISVQVLKWINLLITFLNNKSVICNRLHLESLTYLKEASKNSKKYDFFSSLNSSRINTFLICSSVSFHLSGCCYFDPWPVWLLVMLLNKVSKLILLLQSTSPLNEWNRTQRHLTSKFQCDITGMCSRKDQISLSAELKTDCPGKLNKQ